MGGLIKDVKLVDKAFNDAEEDLTTLLNDTTALKEELSKLYQGMLDALQCECGEELRNAEEEVILKPIANLELVIKQIRDTIRTVKGGDYYSAIFTEFEELKNSF